MQVSIETLEAVVAGKVAELPLIMGNAAVNWVVDSFRVQGFRTVSQFGTAWKLRKDTGPKSQGRDVLIKSGALRRSYRILAITNGSVTIGSDLVYAQIHNEGGVIHRQASQRVLHFKATSQNRFTGKLKGKFSTKSKANYAQKVNVGEYDIRMPKRQAMPTSASDSPIFMKEMEDVVKTTLEPLFMNL